MLFIYSPNSRKAANGLSNDQCPNRKAYSLDLNVSNYMSDNRKDLRRASVTQCGKQQEVVPGAAAAKLPSRNR